MPAFPASDTNAVSWDENAKAHVLSNDTVIQRGFYQILKDATRLTKTNEGPVDDSRHITHMPSFLGTGMTLTWYSLCELTSCLHRPCHFVDNSF